MNETRRLQNESDTGSYSADPGSSRVGQSSVISRQSRSIRGTVGGIQMAEVTSSSVDAAINSLTQNLNSFENNINSFRESMSNLEGTINSTYNTLRRDQSMLQAINYLMGEGNVNVGSGRENAESGEVVERGSGPSNEEERASARAERANDFAESPDVRDARIRTDASTSLVLPPRPESSSPSNGDRTILTGVLRAGNEDDARGTSMGRHNVAPVTVSSTPQRANHLVNSGTHLECNKNRCGNSNEDPKKKVLTKRVVPVNKKIYRNIKRLTHYAEEPTLGRGFIKELCISPDGRIICSPYENGIRLLSFSPTVQDMFHCYPRSRPIPLHELTVNVAHSDLVVSTKFSPYHNLLVSGCMSGNIVYYQPFF